MGSNRSPNTRGGNCVVNLKLEEFIPRLFQALDCDAAFTGPGAVYISRMGYRPAAERFALTYLGDEIVSKLDDGVKSTAKRQRAMERFELAEFQCAQVNNKLETSALGQEPWWMDCDSDAPEDLKVLATVLRLAKKHISRALGAFPGWNEVNRTANFGPGATTRLKRGDGHHANKWVRGAHVTLAASSPLRAALENIPGFVHCALLGGAPIYQVVEGNKLDWVPKNYKTDRTIAIEPDWNMYLQKGLGTLMRRKLKRVGINLDDQERNQLLAYVGSFTGELATIDLSMASDCVAYRLAEFLIRPDWFEAIDAVRSQIGFYSDMSGVSTAVVYEKLSSMGNGYTFEVETLIFWGLARAVSDLMESTDHRLAVYGDDIVVPTGIATEVCRILEQVGFTPNLEKTFLKGPFRESCGAHWFEGDDVSPFYIREPVQCLDRLYLLHNNVARWFVKHPAICPPEKVAELLQWIRSHAPKGARRPSLLNLECGDGGFYGSFTAVRPRKPGVKKWGWDGWVTNVLLYRSKRDVKRASRVISKEDLATRSKDRVHWPMLTNPHFASLRMGLESEGIQWVQPFLVHRRDDGRETVCFGTGRASDLLRALPAAQGKEADVPYRERFWYLGTLITPSHRVESAWWDCIPA